MFLGRLGEKGKVDVGWLSFLLEASGGVSRAYLGSRTRAPGLSLTLMKEKATQPHPALLPAPQTLAVPSPSGHISGTAHVHLCVSGSPGVSLS